MRTKIILTLGLILLISTNCLSQTTDSLIRSFDLSFSKQINYPYTLSKNCIPTITILKIDINQDSHITAMKLSDSADPLFNIEFIKVIPGLDAKSIEKYAKIKGLKNTYILIPVYYSFTNDHCQFPASRISSLVKLMKFNGEDFRDKTIILPTIFNLIAQEVE
jgi:hypothetical protein